jgi:hypothetical protein
MKRSRNISGNTSYKKTGDIYDMMKLLENVGKELSYDKIKQIIRKESMGIIIDARANAPTEDIRESFWFIERKEEKYPTTVLIGPRYYGPFKGQLSHTFEYGTAPRYTKDGQYRGYITAAPFIRPAYDKYQSQIVTNVVKKVFKLAVDTYKQK